MRILYSLLIILGITSKAKGQLIVSRVNVNELPEVKVCRIIATNLGNVINVDYGQKQQWSDDDNIQDGKSTKKKKFNSVSDLINHMENNGWQYVNALPVDQSNTIISYFFRRKEEAGGAKTN